MITKPDLVAKTAPGRPFDRLASCLIGCIAVFAALLAVVQAGQGQIGGRAQLMAARLADDVLTRVTVSELAADTAGGASLKGLDLSFQASARADSGKTLGDAGAQAVAAADQKAADLFQAAVTDTMRTSGGAPLDAYTAGLVTATIPDIATEVGAQRAQVDIATAAGGRGRLAVLGLSFSALAGVLVGLALVLREGRSGWAALLAACGIEGLAFIAGLFAALG